MMNCMLLPIVLGFLFMLATQQLPEEFRLKGWYMWLVAGIYGVTCVFGVVAGIWGVIDGA